MKKNKVHPVITVIKLTDRLVQVKIDNTDAFLEDLEDQRGKITISGVNFNYSYTWWSMGSDICDFVLSVDNGYFAGKLLGLQSCYVMDVPKTFAKLRKHLYEGLALPAMGSWSRFKKESLTRVLRDFQDECQQIPTREFFVDHFHASICKELDYNLIKDAYSKILLQSRIKEISEPWEFIEETTSPEYRRLVIIHRLLKKGIKTKIKSNDK